MARDEHRAETTSRIISSTTTHVTGVLVFLAGIVMIVLVFVWAYMLLANVETEIAQVASAPAATTPASATAESAVPAPQTIVAQPQPGPSLAQVVAILGVKLIVLVAMGWLGALVASKGAQLARST